MAKRRSKKKPTTTTTSETTEVAEPTPLPPADEDSLDDVRHDDVIENDDDGWGQTANLTPPPAPMPDGDDEPEITTLPDDASEPPETADLSDVPDREDDDGDVEPSEGGEDDQAEDDASEHRRENPELNPPLAEGEVDERLPDGRSEAEQSAIDAYADKSFDAAIAAAKQHSEASGFLDMDERSLTERLAEPAVTLRGILPTTEGQAVSCPMCDGSGKHSNFGTGGLETCSRCNGTGHVIVESAIAGGAPTSLGEVWVGETKPDPEVLAEVMKPFVIDVTGNNNTSNLDVTGNGPLQEPEEAVAVAFTEVFGRHHRECKRCTEDVLCDTGQELRLLMIEANDDVDLDGSDVSPDAVRDAWARLREKPDPALLLQAEQEGRAVLVQQYDACVKERDGWKDVVDQLEAKHSVALTESRDQIDHAQAELLRVEIANGELQKKVVILEGDIAALRATIASMKAGTLWQVDVPLPGSKRRRVVTVAQTMEEAVEKVKAACKVDTVLGVMGNLGVSFVG